MKQGTRRDLLKASAATAPFFLMPRGASANAPGARVPAKRKLVLFFLRGGCDGVNMCIPSDALDSSYQTTRGTLAIPESYSLPLAGTQFRLHPRMQNLRDLYGAGRAAFLHRVGNRGGDRSHFKEMQVVETGKPGHTSQLSNEGWVARLAATLGAQVLPAASFSSQLQQFFRGGASGALLPNLKLYGSVESNSAGVPFRPYEFRIDPTTAPALNLLTGRPITGLGTNLGWRDNYNDIQNGDKDAMRLVRKSGSSFFDIEDLLASKLPSELGHDEMLFPQSDPNPPANRLIPARGYELMSHLESAMHVLEETSCQVAGVEIGGWDTHQAHAIPNAAGAMVDGAHADLLEVLSYAMKSADAFVQSSSHEYLFLAVTEFGRTIKPNSADGLDHGVGACYVAVGHGVQPGVHMRGAWDSIGGQATASNEYKDALEPKTDFRAVFAEVLQKHFGLPMTGAASVDSVLPGFASVTRPAAAQLGFLA